MSLFQAYTSSHALEHSCEFGKPEIFHEQQSVFFIKKKKGNSTQNQPPFVGPDKATAHNC